MGKIYVSTGAYNAEKTLARCVDSVLNQTFRKEDIVYYLCDNGSTDHTGDLVREYAENDSRIRPFYNKKNRVWKPNNREFQEFRSELRDDDYFFTLDADDEYALTFLEEMLPFAEDNDLDIAVCGSDMIDVSTGKLIFQRCVQNMMLLTRSEDFSEQYAVYHQFMRTVWGKIYSGRVARNMARPSTMPIEWSGVSYGIDTLNTFSAVRQARRIGLYPKTLHRYFIHPSSVSYQYTPRRFDSDVYLYDDAVDFLSAYGPISEKNKDFLARVYANAVSDTVRVIHNSALSQKEQLREYRRIAEHPVTQKNYHRQHEEIDQSRRNLTAAALDCNDVTDEAAKEDFRAVVEKLIPKCAPAVTLQNVPLLGQENLLNTVLDDDVETILSKLLDLICAQKHTKKYDIYNMVQMLSADKPLLKDINDKKFLRRYGDIYLAVWRERYVEALDAMTGMLLNGEQVNETFLNLYLPLAALENQAPAFIFGKIQLAKLYLRQDDKDACRAVLDELAEMGVEENEEIALMRQALL